MHVERRVHRPARTLIRQFVHCNVWPDVSVNQGTSRTNQLVSVCYPHNVQLNQIPYVVRINMSTIVAELVKRHAMMSRVVNLRSVQHCANRKRSVSVILALSETNTVSVSSKVNVYLINLVVEVTMP